MCEIFGISSREKIRINQYLETFYGHSNKHPHGWGLAQMEGKEVSVIKEPLQASKSLMLKGVLAEPLLVKNAFAHIRYATIGNVEQKNCHPYVQEDMAGRRWTLVHNGTIFDYAPLNRFIHVQKGDTDSERILLYLVELINRREQGAGRALDAAERFQIIDAVIGEMAEGNKLNLLLYDGELVYVHTNYADSLYRLKKEGQAVFSTRPLSDEGWEPVNFMTPLAYREGELVFTGTYHGKEYIDSEENLKFLYQIFSDL